MKRVLLLLLACIILGKSPVAQLCTYPGQTPESAITLCGSATLTMNVPTRCGQSPIPVSCTDGYHYSNKNPVFFRMLCFSSGTLGFNITPIDLNANFSWVLFNVTNTNPADIFTNANLQIACNWSSDLGVTGASADGTALMVCSGPGQNLFSMMPYLARGNTYILMVVDESGSSEPFQLSIEAGTASITDPVEPELQHASVSCDGTQLIVKFNKPLQCATLATDGSDFQLSGPAHIIAAITGDCNTNAGSDSVYLSIDQPLPIGNYSLTMVNGSDGNTMSDNCNRFIPAPTSIQFSVTPLAATKMDSLKPMGCDPGYIELVFKKPIRCNSISPDLSDFQVTGPQALLVQPANCPAGELRTIIRMDLSPANILPGQYQIHLRKGTDGNSLIDQCGMEAPDADLAFEVKEFVVADFSYFAPPTCGKTKVEFSHDGGHHVNEWTWHFGTGLSSTAQNPTIVFQDPGQHFVWLEVSNGICRDSASARIFTNAALQTSFDIPAVLCAGDTIQIVNRSTGSIDQWHWDLGNGQTSSQKDPPVFSFGTSGYDAFYTITLSARNNTLNCEGKTSRVIQVLNDCQLRIPSAFSPNGDGRNDYFYPLHAFKTRQLQFRIFDRNGQLLFFSRDWTAKWDGHFRGQPLPAGVYIWSLEYIDPATNSRKEKKGTVALIR